MIGICGLALQASADLVFLVSFNFLIKIKASDLSRKVRATVPVHLDLVWSKSDVAASSYGQKAVLFNEINEY